MDTSQISPSLTNSNADHERKAAPKLFDLCMATFYRALLFDGNYFAEGFLNLPAYFRDLLLSGMPPFGLLKLEQKCGSESIDGQEGTVRSCGNSNKRKRSEPFSDIWRTLLDQRFPHPFHVSAPKYRMETQFGDNEWRQSYRQLYWQNHLQECLDDVSRCEQPFQAGASSTKVSDYIGKVIFGEWISNESGAVYDTLLYHCQQFGQYAQFLCIESSICTPQLCDLLKSSELRALAFNFFLRPKQVDAVCRLLKQNAQSLRSLTLVVCNLLPKHLEKIYKSLYLESLQSHLLTCFSFSAALFKIPYELLHFLHGRFLRAITFQSVNANRYFASEVFSFLLKNSSCAEVLDLSSNMISGWLSDLSRNRQLLSSQKSLGSLHTLKLRRASLNSRDISDLNNVIRFMPNLKSLDLSENFIKDEGIQILASCITEMAERKCFLKYLALDYCKFTHVGGVPLIESLSSLESPLETLSIAHNDLGWIIAEPIASLINNSLVNLDLSYVKLAAYGCVVICTRINGDLKLENVNLSNNFGKSHTCDLVLRFLAQGPKLQAIKISGNEIPPECICHLRSSLLEATGMISKVDIEGDRFPEPFLTFLESHQYIEGPRWSN